MSKFDQRLEKLAKASEVVKENREDLVDSIVDTSYLDKEFAGLDVDTLAYVFSDYEKLIDYLNEKGFDMGNRVGQGNVAAILPYNGPLMTFALAFAGSYIWDENHLTIKPAGESQPVFEKLKQFLGNKGLGDLLTNQDGSPVLSDLSGRTFLPNMLLPESGVKVLEHYGHDSMITPALEESLRQNPNVRYILEGPGKNRVIVTRSANNPERIADIMLKVGLLNSGQSCMAGEIYDVHEGVHDEVVKQVVKQAANYGVGDPSNPQNKIGPLKRGLAQNIEKQIRNSIENGAKVEFMTPIAHTSIGPFSFHPGDPNKEFALLRYEKNPNYLYVPVTVLSGVTDKMKIRTLETFGPIIPIHKYNKTSELSQGIKDARYGLEMTIIGEPDKELLDLTKGNAGHVFRDAHFLEPGQFDILLSPWGGEKYSRFSLQGTTVNGKPALLKTQTGPDYIVLDFSKPK